MDPTLYLERYLEPLGKRRRAVAARRSNCRHSTCVISIRSRRKRRLSRP
jgi:hypothetical protein